MTDSTTKTEPIYTKCSLAKDATGDEKVTVSTGEICTIQTAVQYGIFGDTSVIRSDFKEGEKIDILQGNDYDYKSQYSLCKLDKEGTNAMQNCVLTTGNPWKTLNDTEQYCTLPYNIKLPSDLKYVPDSKSTFEKPVNIPKWKSKQKCLQEKWYDWFSIPDYHLGNKYALSSNQLHNLKPCSIGFVPSLTTPDKCMSKYDFKDGRYDGTFNYVPIALIHLLGNTSDTLIEKYKVKMSGNMQNISKTAVGTIDQEIYDYITTNSEALNEIYNDIKSDLRPHIQTLMSQPFDDRNIIEPDFEDKDMVQPIINKDRVEDAYNLANIFHNLYTSNMRFNTKETNELYNAWKDKLRDVSGFEISDSKFQKQLLTLKKACDISFNFKNDYSKTLFSIINKDNQKKALEFGAIIDDERIMSISKNISENPDGTDAAEGSVYMTRRDALLKQEETRISELTQDEMELNKLEYDPIKYGDSVHEEVLRNPLAENVTTAKTIVMTGILIIMFLIFFGILYILASILWEPIAELMNTMIMSFYVGMLKTKDAFFRGADEAPSFNKDILALQKDILSKKIMSDAKKYKLNIAI